MLQWGADKVKPPLPDTPIRQRTEGEDRTEKEKKDDLRSDL